MTTTHKQTVTLGELAGHPRLTVNTNNTRPSWKRYGDGHNSIEFWFHPKAKSISVDCREFAIANPAAGEKRDTEKRAMVTLDEAAARALLAQLQVMLGE
jgi:hypothetical protein